MLVLFKTVYDCSFTPPTSLSTILIGFCEQRKEIQRGENQIARKYLPTIQ